MTFETQNPNMTGLDLSKEIEEIYKTTMPVRPYLKKSFHRPVFCEENYPLIKGGTRPQKEKLSFMNAKYYGTAQSSKNPSSQLISHDPSTEHLGTLNS